MLKHMVINKMYNEWEKTKKKYKKDKCRICYSRNNLCLHHHTYAGEKSLYITLCRTCHYNLHFLKGKKVNMARVRKNIFLALRLGFVPILTRRQKKKMGKEKYNKHIKSVEKKEKNFKLFRRYSKIIDYSNMVKFGNCKP